MQVNYFDPESRVFLHSADAMPNPKRKGEYFKQAFSTFDLLPDLGVGQVALRDVEDSVWLVVEDNRGTAWNVETKEPVDVIALGELSGDLTKDEPGEFDVWVDGGWQKDVAEELVASIKLAVADVQLFATGCRRKLVEGVDEVKLAEYADKAALARFLMDGSATVDEKAAALADPWAVAGGMTDPAVVGAEWMRKATALRGFRNKVNQLERDAVESVQLIKSVDLIEGKLAELLEQAEAELAEFLKQI